MIVRFIGQPFEGEANLYDYLVDVLADGRLDSLLVVTAWAKRSGLRRLDPDLRRFRDRAGRSQIIVGIDEGGATHQGLRLALELFDEVRVFHDPTRRTFHPKIYVARGANDARVLIGSNNFTAGGVFFNYEAAVDVHLDLRMPTDVEFLQEVDDYARHLLSEEDLCLTLDLGLLDQLVASRRLRIQDEDEARERQADEPEDVDQTGLGGDRPDDDERLFGRGQLRRRPDPAPPRRVAAAAAPMQPSAGQGTATTVTTALPQGTQVVRRWIKELARSDAQQPTTGSKPTGNLRLTQAGLPIDWRTFFRFDLFGPAPWTAGLDSQGNPIETTVVPFLAFLHGNPQGSHGLTIDHAPHREAGQANHLTVLHWDDLAPLLRETSFIGDFVVIERFGDGTYRLEIRPDSPIAIV